MSLIATDAALIEVAESLGLEADRLVAAGTGESHEALVAADLVSERLAPAVSQLDPTVAECLEAGRRVRLAAAVSQRAAASGAGELHHRDLPASAAIGHALRGVASHQLLSPHAVQDRVRARFPALAPLPDRPDLDSVVAEAGLDLVFDADKRAYRGRTASADTTGLDTRQPTRIITDVAPISTEGVAGQRLRDSRARRSFLALGVPGHRLDRALRVLTEEFGAHQIDLTGVLLAAIRAQAEQAGMKWSTIEAADAAEPGTRPAQGLAALVERALPAVTNAVEESMDAADESQRPVLLTEASSLARYDRLGVLAQWTDLTRPRRQAVWLLVPQLRNVRGPVIDGRPITLNSPGQFLPLDTEWIDSRDLTLQQTTTSTAAGAAP